MKRKNYLLLLVIAMLLCFGNTSEAQLCGTAPTVAGTWSCNSISLFWSNNPNAVDYQYRIDSSAVTIVQGNTTTTSVFVSNLSPATIYIAAVRSICGAGDTSIWNFYTFITPSCGNCAIPPTPNVTWGCNSASLFWSPSMNAVDYQYRLDSAGITLNQGNTQNTNIVFNPLTQGTPYIGYVRSVCGAGDTSAWSAAPFTTSYCGQCAAPAWLSGLAIGCDSIVFAWDSIIGNTGFEYALTFDTLMPASTSWIATTNAHAFAGSLVGDTTYYIQLRSNCVTNGYSLIKKIAVTTPPCTTTSTGTETEKVFAKIYPNPVSSVLHITLSKLYPDAVVEIISMDGRVVKKVRVVSKEVTMDVGDLQQAIYIIRYDYNGKTAQYKLNKL